MTSIIQTQLEYDTAPLERWLEALASRDLLSKAYVLVGVGPLRLARVARYMHTRIPDIAPPSRLVDLMERSPEPEEKGLEIDLELIEQIRILPGARGIHIMSLVRESILPRLLVESGLTARITA